jgi:predicted nucleic acid-binding Zn ribbon protein
MPLELIDRARPTNSAIGLVTCPNCQVTMRRVFLKPVDGEANLREAAYRCPRCDAETKRWLRP